MRTTQLRWRQRSGRSRQRLHKSHYFFAPVLRRTLQGQQRPARNRRIAMSADSFAATLRRRNSCNPRPPRACAHQWTGSGSRHRASDRSTRPPVRSCPTACRRGTRISIIRSTRRDHSDRSQGVRDSCLEAQRTDALELGHVGLGNNGFFVKHRRPRFWAKRAWMPPSDCAPLKDVSRLRRSRYRSATAMSRFDFALPHS